MGSNKVTPNKHNLVQDTKLTSGKKLYLDGGGDTFIEETSADTVNFKVGNDIMLVLDENGTNGNIAYFKSCCAGFSTIAETFSDDSIIGSGGTHDTHFDFRHTNKSILTLTADITDVHFQFPSISGNFLCVFLQDGTGGWDVTNWKTKDAAGNAGNGNSGVVRFAGGTGTSLTETADRADIISIYWDATNEMAYAVASENF
jgi:hypothetical protein